MKRSAATRELLVDATERLICEGGLSSVTTQAVARNCGLSEGSIYRHFRSREELIVTTLRERLPGEFQPFVDELNASAGKVPLKKALATFVASIVPIFTTVAPCLGMLAADPALAARNAEASCADGSGPRLLVAQLAEFIESEQRACRVAKDISPNAAAGLLVGLCFYRSLMSSLFREDPVGVAEDEFASAIATIVSRGVEAQLD